MATLPSIPRRGPPGPRLVLAVFVLLALAGLGSVALAAAPPAAVSLPNTQYAARSPQHAAPPPCCTYIVTDTQGILVPGVVDTGNHCNDCVTTLAMPITFTLYCTTYISGTLITLSSNGNLQFGSTNTDATNACLPAPPGLSGPWGDTIFAYWSDLDTTNAAPGCAAYTSGCGIYASITPGSPRILNLEWRAVQFGSTNLAHFTIRLYENTNHFEVAYGALPPGLGSGATVGVQQAGGAFTQYECNTPGTLHLDHILQFGCNVQGQATPTPSPTRCPVPPGCGTDTPTATPTCPPGQICGTDTPTATPTCPPGQICGTDTPTATPTCPPGQICGTDTPTATPTCQPGTPGCGTATPTATPTCQPGTPGCGTATPTPTNTSTNTPSNTPTRTPTNTPTRTPTNTATNTPTNTATNTPTRTPTNTPTNTATNTPTSTVTRTATPTPTCIILGHYTATIVVGTVTIIAGTQDLGNHCNDCLSQLIFPFPVQFYGDSYGKAVASSNGNIQFVPESTSSAAPCLPNPALDTTIMLYQGDLDTSGPGEGIFSATLGTAPNRTFVLEWRTHYVGRNGTSDEEVIFTENDSTIRMVYGPNADDGQNEVSGMQLGPGTQYDQYACHTGLLTAGKGIIWPWTPPIILCTPTPTPTHLPTATPTPTICVTTILSNGFESGTLEGYTSTVAPTPGCISGGCGWTNVGTAAHTGLRSLFAPDVNEPSDQQLTSPAFTVPAASPQLIFWHRYALEHPLWDGGELEISPNGGPWVTVTPAAISPPYPPGTIPGTFSNPLVGKFGWTNQNPSWPGWDQITVNLSAYASIPNTRFRFRLGTDHGNAGQGPALGWWIDDITVTGLCNTPTPTRTRTPTATITPTATPTLPCVPTPVGMTYWYPLDETSGSIGYELVGGKNAFEFNAPAHVPGKVAGGLNFNGVNQWAGVYPPWNSPQLGTGDFSIDLWVNVSTATLSGLQVMLDGRNFAPRGYALFLLNGQLGLQMADQLPPPAGYSNYIAPGTLTTGWHLVAATVQRVTNGGTLYVDGVPVLTFSPRLGNLSSNAPLWIGRHHPNASFNLTLYFAGSLDEIEFFNHALLLADIQSIYNAGGGGKCKPATATPTRTPTPGPCWWCSADVPISSPFYLYVTNLLYQGVISGYTCGSNPNEPCVPPGNYPYYRPGANITRGQIAKIVALAAGFTDVPTGQSFADVPPTQPFWVWIEQLSSRHIISGYTCGSNPNEPCVPPGNLPYYRPGNNVTRAQLAKIVANAAGITDDPGPQLFADVPSDHPFYSYINPLARRGVISGYTCGSNPNEPCVPPGNLPYYRPGLNVTRGQAAKIVANTFLVDDWLEP